MTQASLSKSFRLRSFVKRDSRMTPGQKQAYRTLWPTFGLDSKDGYLECSTVFQREAPVFLEIGFGSGVSLLALAKAHPDKNFIGIETYQPGVGSLLIGIAAGELTNLRIYQCDAVDVLEKCLKPASLDGILVFFPDPWPKRRHHPRRLIQLDLVNQLADKLKSGGLFHLATDWEDYADHMMTVMSAASGLVNTACANQFAGRSPYRPVETRFEHRATQEGRAIWELQFRK